jgi:4-hydroxybenzoate polyprenyltransferase
VSARPAALASPSALISVEFVRAYWTTMRPYLLFVSGAAGLAGLALGPTLPAGDTLLLAAVFFLAYGFGQALTDCFQMDTDTLSSPYRPLVRGTVRRGDVLRVSLAGLALCGAVVVKYAAINLVLAGLTVLGLITYTWFKRRWWGGPPYNAAIVGLLCLIGYASATGGALGWSRAVAGTLAAVVFGYANFVLTGSLKDVSADRRTGYQTLPVAFGLKVTAVTSDALAVMALGGCALALAGMEPLTGGGMAGLGFVVAGAGASMLAQARVHRVRDERQAHLAIAPVVHAFVLTVAGLAAVRKPAWALPLLLYYLAFGLILHRRPVREQI